MSYYVGDGQRAEAELRRRLMVAEGTGGAPLYREDELNEDAFERHT